MRTARMLLAAFLVLATGADAQPPTAPPKLAAAGERWRWVTSPRFELLTNGSERRARDVIERLESFRAAIAQLLGGAVSDPARPIRILLFDRVWDFAPYQVLRADGKPETFSGYFLGRGETNWFALSSELDDFVPRILLHEYSHLLIARQLGRPPAWLNEGLAEYLSAFRWIERQRRAEIGRPIVEHMRFLNSSTHLPLRQLLAMDYGSAAFAREVPRSLFYSKSWLLVHYFQIGSEARAGALARFAQLRSQGVDDLAAFERAAGASIEQIDDELVAYQRRSLISYRALDVPPFEPAPVTTRPAETADALFRLGEYLLALGAERRADAEAHFARAGRPAPPPESYARSGHADELAGIGAASMVDSSSFEELRAAMAAQPDAAEPRRRFAQKVLVESRAAGLADPALLAEARRALREAAALEPATTHHLQSLLFHYSADEGALDLAEGIAAVEAGYARAPGEETLGLGLVRLFERAGQRERARELATRLLATAQLETVRAPLETLLANQDMEEATRLAATGRGTEALELLDLRLAALTDGWVVTRVREHRDKLAPVVSSNRALEIYNRAVALVREKRYEEARAALREVVDGYPNAVVAAQARKSLSDLEAFLAKRSSPKPSS